MVTAVIGEDDIDIAPVPPFVIISMKLYESPICNPTSNVLGAKLIIGLTPLLLLLFFFFFIY